MNSLQPTAVIAEDEPVLRAQLQEMLAAVWPQIAIVGTAEDGLAAISALEQHDPDVLFLDITSDGESVIRKPLKELLDELDPAMFWQIHRSTIVNVNAIASISHNLAGHMVVKLKHRKETLQVSQTFAHLFRQM
jgi:DNA-binding LytR/AlgR family response regulator